MSPDIKRDDLTALINSVSEQLVGTAPITQDDQKIIDRISHLRTEGKLSKDQIALLDRLGEIASLDTGWSF